jgi:hypothetical protein
MIYFDIYFSARSGLQIDFPFLQLEIPTYALAIVAISVVVLRVRKLIADRKRVAIRQTVSSDFDSDPFDIDWSAK